MSTHDYVIDDQSAVAFRADLNSALAAIVTQNSNATAPVTTFANMIWYDTTAKQLKKRNESNSAWIVLGTVDEALGTFTPTGGPALSSQAQAEAGTDNTTTMTPLRVAQAINVLANVPDYESAEQTVLQGSLVTLTHGLGVQPKLITVTMRCKIAQSPYAVGEEVMVAQWHAGGNSYGASATANATSIVLRQGTSPIYLHTNTGTTLGPIGASWRLVVRAWK